MGVSRGQESRCAAIRGFCPLDDRSVQLSCFFDSRVDLESRALDVTRERELPRIHRRRKRYPRIRQHRQRLAEGLPVRTQFHLVLTWRFPNGRFGVSEVVRRERRLWFAAQIPNDAMGPRVR